MHKLFHSILLLLTTAAISTHVFAAEWDLSGDMTLNHQWHRAIKLNDGRVLVTGSWVWDQSSGTTEVYDPATGNWTGVGNVVASRASLTLLADGRVLLAGGELPDFWNGSTPTNSAYLFDPAANTWRQTAYLNTSSSRHSGILLPDGKVLIAGGTGKLTEIFDPVTETWSYGPDMNYNHYAGTLAVLSDGSALIAGSGDSEYGTSSSDAEIYQPVSNSWNAVHPMNIARRAHKTLVLLDGRVMVIGGFNPDGTAQNTAEIYDPSTDSWTLTGPMTIGGIEFSATTLADGKVLVTGGASANGLKAEVYLPDANTWELAGDMPIARRRHTGILLDNGQVLIAGGMPTAENITSILYTFSGTTPPPPVVPPEPIATHVASLAGSTIAKGKRYWQAVATITVVDNLEDPVANATVSAHWAGSVTGETVCNTDQSGVCSMTSDKTKSVDVIFYVDDITHASLTYDANANTESHIIIDRPF